MSICRKNSLLCVAVVLFLGIMGGIGFNNSEVCADVAEPTGTKPPIVEPFPDIPDADFVDVYIQALEQSCEVAPELFAKKYIALDFSGRQVLTDEDEERVEEYLWQKGYMVKTPELERFERQGLVRRDDQNNWILPEVTIVSFYVDGLIESGKLYVTCSVTDNFYASCRGTLIYTEKEGRWQCQENRMEWCGDERYFPRRLMGDIDGNAVVELSDACQMLKIVLKIVPEEEKHIYFDLNGDGNLTLEDAADVLKQALKIESPVYYVPLQRDRIYADVVDLLQDDLRVTDTREEAVAYLQEIGLTEAVQCISRLSEKDLENGQIVIVVSSTNVYDKTRIESYPYLKTNSDCLYNHCVVDVATQDEKSASYVQIFLMNIKYKVNHCQITGLSGR